MRPAVLISVILLLGVSCRADDSEEECDCSHRRGGFRGELLRSRADNNDVEINRLFQASWTLEKKLDALSEGPDVAELKARVDALTGNDCDDGLFECGDRGGCVDPLQVCDGSTDCTDGSDEGDDTCTILAPEGSSWGSAISHSECFRVSANHIRFIISKAERSDVLGSAVRVEVATFLYSGDGELSIGKAEGYYNYGTRSLNFRAVDGDILDLSCHFNSYDHQSCHAKLYRGLSETSCGEIVLQRE